MADDISRSGGSHGNERATDPQPTGDAIGHEQHIAELVAQAVARDARILELISEVENLHAAAETRAVIEQAKGVIMNTAQCGPDAAFAVLVAQSQHENRKLRDVAAELAGMQDRA